MKSKTCYEKHTKCNGPSCERKTYTDAEVEAQFEANQKDLMLGNVRVQWAGSEVHLFTPDQANIYYPAGIITANARACFKVKLWCVKNHYRCLAISGWRIWL